MPGENLRKTGKEMEDIAAEYLSSRAVRILEIQAPGGKRMKPEDYLRGHGIPVGTDLKEDRA